MRILGPGAGLTHDLVAVITKQCADAVIPPDGVFFNIPVPDSIHGGIGNGFKTLGVAVNIVDVDSTATPFDDGAVFVSNRSALNQVPAPLAIVAQQSEFQIIGFTSFNKTGPAIQQQFHIIRIHGFLPVLDQGAAVSTGIARKGQVHIVHPACSGSSPQRLRDGVSKKLELGTVLKGGQRIVRGRRQLAQLLVSLGQSLLASALPFQITHDKQRQGADDTKLQCTEYAVREPVLNRQPGRRQGSTSSNQDNRGNGHSKYKRAAAGNDGKQQADQVKVAVGKAQRGVHVQYQNQYHAHNAEQLQ